MYSISTTCTPHDPIAARGCLLKPQGLGQTLALIGMTALAVTGVAIGVLALIKTLPLIAVVALGAAGFFALDLLITYIVKSVKQRNALEQIQPSQAQPPVISDTTKHENQTTQNQLTPSSISTGVIENVEQVPFSGEQAPSEEQTQNKIESTELNEIEKDFEIDESVSKSSETKKLQEEIINRENKITLLEKKQKELKGEKIEINRTLKINEDLILSMAQGITKKIVSDSNNQSPTEQNAAIKRQQDFITTQKTEIQKQKSRLEEIEKEENTIDLTLSLDKKTLELDKKRLENVKRGSVFIL